MPKYDVCVSSTKGLALGGIQDSLQNALIGFAKDEFEGFLLNEFGIGKMIDPFGSRLSEIGTKLTSINAELVQVQTSIDNTYTQGVDTDLDTALGPLVDDVTAVFTLYDSKFEPAVRAEIAYGDANKAAVDARSTCDATQTCIDARRDFNTARTKFLQAQDTPAYLGLNDTIHNYLVPTGGRSSVVTRFGKFVMAHSTGFLTRATSDRLLAFYKYFADAEATATWMKAEWAAVEYGPDTAGRISDTHKAEFRRFLVQTITGDPQATPAVKSYFQKELGFLPPLIPANAVISLSPNASNRTTTANRPMWLYDPQYVGANLAWLPTQQAVRDGRADFETTSDFSVGHALKRVNDAGAGGFSDWRVPSQDEWKGLFTGWNTTKDLRAFLGDMYPTDQYWHSLLPLALYTMGDRLWTRTSVTADSKCLPQGSVMHLRVPTEVNTTHSVSSYDGRVEPTGPGPELYGAGVSECYDNAWRILNGLVQGRPVHVAQLIVSRDTGNLTYMAEQ
jgi:hypothetical protein